MFTHVFTFTHFSVNIGREKEKEKDKDKEKEKGERDEGEKEKVGDSNETSMMSAGSVSLPSLKVGNMISKPSPESLAYNPTSMDIFSFYFIIHVSVAMPHLTKMSKRY